VKRFLLLKRSVALFLMPLCAGLLCAWFGFALFVEPLRKQGDYLRTQIASVRKVAANAGRVSVEVDSLRSVRERMRAWADSLRVGVSREVPGPDSIAALARGAGVVLEGMEVQTPVRSEDGVYRHLRVAVGGSSLGIVRFLDSLLGSSPRIRIERANWDLRGSGSGLRPLELILWDSLFASPRIASTEGQVLLGRRFTRPVLVDGWDSLAMSRLFGHAEVRVVTKSSVTSEVRAPVLAPPALTVTGIVEGRMANCIDSKGNRVLLKPGLVIQGWVVESINANSVTLLNGPSRHVLSAR